MSDNIEKSKVKQNHIVEIIYSIIFTALLFILMWGISIYLK